MKKIVSIILILNSYFTGFSQTANSIANGNWMNPFTWDCTCVPLPGYTVTINHNVSLDTSLYISSGGITINSGASLLENNTTRDIWVNGGSLANNGTLTLHYLWTNTGTFSNSGIITLRSFLNNINFTNAGTIQNLDSMYNTGTIINNGNFLTIDSITNAGTFTNNGICTYHQFTNSGTYVNNKSLTFTDITNNGTLNNTDTMIATHSGWNTAIWNNQSGSYFLVDNIFLNDDPIQHVAVFNNNGRMVVNNSWYNYDTVKGVIGSFQVADTSANMGWMKGAFDFCDLTPPNSAPYVDINTGTISNLITWCQYNGIPEIKTDALKLFPNPTSDFITIEMQNQNFFTIKIYNSSGSLINEYYNQTKINVSEYPSGLYFVSVITGNNIYRKKVQLIK
jgi:hypothetical protein